MYNNLYINLYLCTYLSDCLSVTLSILVTPESSCGIKKEKDLNEGMI